MKIKDEFIIKTIAGQNVVVSTAKKAIDFDYIIHLNDSGKLLFEALMEKDLELDDLVKILTDNYNISSEQALEDVKEFVEILKVNNFLL